MIAENYKISVKRKNIVKINKITDNFLLLTACENC